MPNRQGSIHLFRFAGINVYLHWSWFLVAIYTIQFRSNVYTAWAWNAWEYLALFGIVLLHEFGHALACRSVGGKADQIVLWPLGGVAYVAPPQRPGAQLWSIAAGPLVNVILFPLLTGLIILSRHFGWDEITNIHFFLKSIWLINLVLLIFNMLPVYPLDGGQILRSLLWFVLGRGQSLLVASIIGLVGVAGFIVYAIIQESIWMGIMSAFILMNCWGGLMQARALGRIAKMPKRSGFACPDCKIPPPIGKIWRCGKCGKSFDIFEILGTCPECGTQFSATACFECGNARPLNEWILPPPVLNN